MVWVVGLWVGCGSGQRGLPTFPHRRASRALWKYGKPLVYGISGLADSGVLDTNGPDGSRRYLSSVGLEGGSAWEGEIMLGLGVLVGLRILGLLLLRGGLGYGPPLPRSSQGSDRGIRCALGYRWAVAISNPRC